MKKVKLSKKVQIVLASIFVIVICAILFAIFMNNDVWAIGKCPVCKGPVTHYHQSSNTHQWVCDTNSIHHDIEPCTGGSWRPSTTVSNGHAKYCVYCGWATATGTCYDNNNDGNCDVCGRTGMHTHSYSETSYTQNDGTTHNIVKRCSCGATQNAGTEAHTFGASTDNGDGKHSSTCSKCNYKKTEAHKGATHENGGKCTVCQQQYETHSKSSTIKNYTKTQTGHTPIYTCTHSGCSGTYSGTESPHTGATHENGGKCTVCQQQYETHSKSNKIKEYTKTETAHTPMYECTHQGCTQTYAGIPENHTGATHENGGKCTICQQQYETHGKSETIKEYIKTETTHTPIYKCLHEGCTETYQGKEEPHKNETYIDNGDGTHSSTCTECGGITTENHNFEDGTCTNCQSKEPDIETGSDKYEFLEGNVTNIQPHTEVNVFKQNLQTNATEINIYNLENKLLEDTEIVATGMKLELKKGKQVKTFTLIVRGDVNGDGEADFKDITKINKVRLNKETLEKIHSIAAEVTGDGEVDFKDIVKINRFRLSKIKEL